MEELAKKIQRTFVFDLDVSDETNNQKLLADEFLKWEIRKILSLVRFTSGGKPVNVDGYIKIFESDLKASVTLLSEKETFMTHGDTHEHENNKVFHTKEGVLINGQKKSNNL